MNALIFQQRDVLHKIFIRTERVKMSCERPITVGMQLSPQEDSGDRSFVFTRERIKWKSAFTQYEFC